MNNFGRQSLTLGQSANYNTGTGWEYLEVINESPYMLTLNFSGLGAIDFPAWYDGDIDMYDANKKPLSYTGSLVITPSNIASGQTGAPSTLVSVNGWALGEKRSPKSVALSRLTNVGNGVNTVLGIASAVQNDGSTAGTSIVESTVQGDSSSAVSLTNAAHLTLGTVNNPAIVNILGTLGSSSQIQIDALSTLIVPQQIHANLIKTITGNDFTIDVETGHKIALQVNNADVVDINSTGIQVQSGAYNFQAGSTTSGGTSGSVSIYEYMNGNAKRILVYMTSYRSGASAQTIALPTAFSKGCFVICGGIGVSGSGGLQLLASSVAQSINILTALSGGGGSTSPGTTIFAYSLGECINAFDSLSFPANTTSAHTAFIQIEGQ